MLISDCSSDVCSSDLADMDHAIFGDAAAPCLGEARDEETRPLVHRRIGDHQLRIGEGDRAVAFVDLEDVFGACGLADPRAVVRGGDVGEDRKSVVSGRSVSVRVNLGWRRNIKKKKKKAK